MTTTGRNHRHGTLAVNRAWRRNCWQTGIPSATTGMFLALILVVTVSGCQTGPQVRLVTHESYTLQAVGDAAKQTVGNVAVEDLGEASGVVRPVRVQACDGRSLRYHRRERKDKKGKKRIEKTPIFETVDPFEGIHVRLLRIRNDTRRVLPLNRIDAVLVDAVGNDNELVTKAGLRRDLRARRPCPSTRKLVRSLRGVALLGADIRIRPGRVVDLYAAFSGVDRRIVGDWTLELFDFPVTADPDGRVLSSGLFRIPLLSRGYRTTVTQRKEELFAPWRDIHRTTEEIRPGS